MFGRITGIGVTDDRIYVADDQFHAVRVYDREGRHLFDFGREGEGPGEFDAIRRMDLDPASGRVIVQSASRVTVFDPDGDFVETWPYRSSGSPPLTVTLDGTAYVPTRWTEGDERVVGMIGVESDGSESERLPSPVFDTAKWRLVARQGDAVSTSTFPLAPSIAWSVLPSGAIVEGLSDAYRFEVRFPDGNSMVVERAIELLPVSADEAEWLTARVTALMRRVQPDWSWPLTPIPDHRPAFLHFRGDRYGRIWVVRALRTDEVTDCDPNPLSVEDQSPRYCWRDVFGLDVFDEEDGRYLGEVEVPIISIFGAPPALAFLRDSLIVAVQDEAGTIMVKRYRLVLPGEQER